MGKGSKNEKVAVNCRSFGESYIWLAGGFLTLKTVFSQPYLDFCLVLHTC